jgi:streptomycin 6-kinase
MPSRTNALLRARSAAKEWGLTLGEELPGATCSVVLAATDEDGNDLVLKAPFANAEECESGPVMVALGSHGAVEVLRLDPVTSVVLMPRLRPGTNLADSGLSDLEGVRICAELILRLRKAPRIDAMPLARWCKELFEDPTNALILEARKVCLSLLDTSPPPVLLHGDLHHYNILSHNGTWLFIDPKGIAGDPAFDIAGYMRNPIGRAPGPEGMAQRLRLFADLLGDPPYRLWGWAFSETVLCAKQDGYSFTDSWCAAAEAIWDVRAEFVRK